LESRRLDEFVELIPTSLN